MGFGFDVNEFIKYVGALIALLDPISAVPLMLSLTLYVIIDFEYPRLGMIRIPA